MAAALSCSAALVGLTPVIFALSASGSPLARPLGLTTLALALGAFLWLGIVRARREVSDLGATARLLAQRVESPELRRGLLPAYELSRELSRSGPVDFSRALACAHIESIATAARQTNLDAALPDRPVRTGAQLLLVAAAILVCAVALFRGPMTLGARMLWAGVEGAGPKAASLAEPITGEIELTFLYPAYTRLPARTVPNTNGEISAPKGTQVRLKTRADRELAQAVVVCGQNALPLQVQGRALSGSLLVDVPGSYRFRFLDARGRTLVEGPPIPIAVEEDQRPKANIVVPMGDVEVDPKSRVTIRYEADDDFGLSEVALLFKLPGATKPERLVLQRASATPRRSSGEHVWDLVAPGLMPGDTVAYYLEATDNDEVSGKKTGVSRTQYLKIFSQAEHHRKLVRQIAQAWEKLVTHLADRLEAPDRKAEGRTIEKILSQAAVDTRGLDLGRELSELARTLRKDRSPEPLWRALGHIGAGMTEKAAASSDARATAAQWLRRGAGLDSDPVRRLSRAVEAEIDEVEKDVLYLEALVDQQRLEDLAVLSRELSAKRRDLSDLLEKYRTAPDDETRQKLFNEMARLKARMAELMQRMAELSKGINDEHINEEALRELDDAAASLDAFDTIQELLHQGKVEEAMKELEKIGQSLDELEKKLQKAARGEEDGSFSGLGRQLSDFARDIDQLEQDQQQVLEQTQKLRERTKQALQERVQRKGADFVQRLRKKADEARKRLEAVANPRSFWREDDLKRAQEAIEDLDKALAVKDFDQAAESVAKGLLHADQLAQEMERAAQESRRFPAELKDTAAEAQKNARNARGAVPPLEQIRDELQSLIPPPSAAMSAQDRQRMKELAQRQGQLQRQAGQLRQRMEELNQQGPLFPGSAQQMMQGVGNRMGQAQGQMQANNPTGASAQERAALDQLGELKQGLQRERGGASGEGGSVPWPWMGKGSPAVPGDEAGDDGGLDGSSSQEKVEIPDADKYQVPEEYRKDILDAMKQGAPEKYKDQVKRYYEEIVK
ncbi:MAG: DUF4175 family protein [Deltaproteobacteria bacterium]|nr:DUF4175 family protein [Deltaproteobacteria bacterium]